MHTVRALLFSATLIALLPLHCAYAQEEMPPLTLTNQNGATITFTEEEPGLWRWTGLAVPGGADGGWSVGDREVLIATPQREEWTARAWPLVQATGERLVFEQTVPGGTLQIRRVFVFGPANTLRIETFARATEGPATLARIELLNTRVRGEVFRETGPAPASFPLFGEALFAGIEHVSGETHTEGDTIELSHRPMLTADATWQPLPTVVIGWPQPEAGNGLTGAAGMREAFLQYLDTVRVKPDRIVLHSETWWTLPPPLLEKNVLNDIETLKKAFFDRTGMFFDTYALDLGWSDPRTLWQIETTRFPDGFNAVNERLSALGTKLGLWMSPGSGYPEGLSNPWLQSQGYDLTPFEGLEPGAPCFALGTRYQREFKERIVGYAQRYGLGHVILDFMAQRCDVPTHGHPTGYESRYAIDAGVADVLDALRAVNPQIALEPMVCGYPPSPWWLMKTPFILGPAGDDMPYGRVPCPDWMESLITARDIAYRAGQDAWIMPSQALETWDIIVQTPGEFENLAVMAIGRGRWFISSYINPNLMKPEDWDFFAALIRWARHNKQYLGNAWLFGGRPEDRQPYGYMFRNRAKDIYCVRNPWIREQSILLPISQTFTEPRDVRMIYPRRATLARIEPGGPRPRIAVAPYETMVLETVPADDTRVIAAPPAAPRATLLGGATRMLSGATVAAGEDEHLTQYLWGGTLSLDAPGGAELCILVEGGAEVDRASCRVSLGGRDVTPRKVGSAGQFASATDILPENWTWFIVPIPSGDTPVQIELTLAAPDATIGVYVRGTMAAENDPAPGGDDPVFPVFNPNRRAWSQVLLPRTAYPSEL